MPAIRLLCISLGMLLWISSTTATFTCPTLFNYYPDANDCTKFYRCAWGKGYSFNCPAGTRWSQSLLTCDHTSNVPCHKYPITHTTVDPYTGAHVVQPVPEAQNPDFSVDQDKHTDGLNYRNSLRDGNYASGNYDYNQGKYKSESVSHASNAHGNKVDSHSQYSYGENYNSHSQYSYGENYNSHSNGDNYQSTTDYGKYPNSHYGTGLYGHNQYYMSDQYAQPGNNYVHYSNLNNEAEYTTQNYYSDYSTPHNDYYSSKPHPSYQYYHISTAPSHPVPPLVNSQGSSYHDSYAYTYNNVPEYGRGNFYASYVNSDDTRRYGPLDVTESYQEFPVRGYWPLSDLFRAGYGRKRIYHK